MPTLPTLLIGLLLVALLLLAALAARRRSVRVAEVEQLRRDAQQRSSHAEQLAEELQQQAVHQQEQAVELELLNEELRAVEARLRGVIESALDAIVTTDANSVVTGWNSRAEAMFGWSEAEALGRNLNQLIIPERYREGHQRGVEHYLATGEGPILNRRIEIEALRRDGTELVVELAVAPVHWGNQVLFSSFLRDVTERRRLEQRLTAERAVSRALAESHHLQEAAPRILAAIGESVGWEFGGFWAVHSDEQRLHCVATWQGSGGAGAEFERHCWEWRFARGEGLPGRVWQTAAPVWITDVATDDNFPRAEGALAAGLHGAFAFPILHGDAVLGVVEFLHRQVLHPNDTVLAMVTAIGTDIGQAMRRVQAEEERDRALADMATANVRLQEINEALAEQTRVAEQARTEADQANRAKSDFLATMSHELRTPLNAILGYVELMEIGIGGPPTPQQLSHLERIRASGRHLLMLIEDILDLAKIEAGRIEVAQERTRVVEAVTAAVALVAPQAVEAEIQLMEQCEDADATYVGDEDRVRQIVLNLLSNAVKFTEAGGRVTVTCGRMETPDGPTRLTGAGPWAFVRVEDTGVGIAREELDSVFEPFVQAERGHTRTRGGTGLGLTISRQLARMMDGDLTLRSEPGRGSCFTLWLPTQRAAESQSATEPLPAAAGQEFQRVGEALQWEIPGLLRSMVERLRSDPRIPMARGLHNSELEDHQGAFLMDLLQTLVVLGSPVAGADLLRDGAELQRAMALNHGAQRAQQAWTEDALRREFQILREEVAALVSSTTGAEPEADGALALLLRLLEQAEETSLRGLRGELPPRAG